MEEIKEERILDHQKIPLGCADLINKQIYENLTKVSQFDLLHFFFSKTPQKNVAVSKYNNNNYLRVVQSTTFNIIPLIQFKPKFKIVGVVLIAKKASYKELQQLCSGLLE